MMEVQWKHLLGDPKKGEAPFDPHWKEALKKAKAAALPRTPVEGKAEFAFLALPRSLPAALKEGIQGQFDAGTALEEIEDDLVLLVRVSQGYEA